jgi:hypothetical protein
VLGFAALLTQTPCDLTNWTDPLTPLPPSPSDHLYIKKNAAVRLLRVDVVLCVFVSAFVCAFSFARLMFCRYNEAHLSVPLAASSHSHPATPERMVHSEPIASSNGREFSAGGPVRGRHNLVAPALRASLFFCFVFFFFFPSVFFCSFLIFRLISYHALKQKQPNWHALTSTSRAARPPPRLPPRTCQRRPGGAAAAPGAPLAAGTPSMKITPPST